MTGEEWRETKDVRRETRDERWKTLERRGRETWVKGELRVETSKSNKRQATTSDRHLPATSDNKQKRQQMTPSGNKRHAITSGNKRHQATLQGTTSGKRQQQARNRPENRVRKELATTGLRWIHMNFMLSQLVSGNFRTLWLLWIFVSHKVYFLTFLPWFRFCNSDITKSAQKFSGMRT
jgi:hypothetical protein